MSFCYIYGLVDPRTGVLMYVGKTVNLKNRLRQHLKPRSDQKMTKVKSWIVSILRHDLLPEIRLIETCGKDVWEERERFHISEHRKQNPALLNMADGGGQPFCDDQSRMNSAKRIKKFTQENKGVLALVRFMRQAAKSRKASGDLDAQKRFDALAEYIRTSEGTEHQRFNELGRRKCLETTKRS